MTNPPIPPAVVEAMARATYDSWYGDGPSDWDELPDDDPSKHNHRLDARTALSAALATGSVVICSPELKEVVDAALIGLERFDKHAMSAEFSHEMFDTLRKHREFMLGITRLAQARAQAAATQ